MARTERRLRIVLVLVLTALIGVGGWLFERFPSALSKTAFPGHQLDIDTPLWVFDWSGNQGSTLRGRFSRDFRG